MSEGDDFHDELCRTDPWVRAITPQRIEKALADFALPFAEGSDFIRLAHRIQGVANFAREHVGQSDFEAKKQLLRLAQKTNELRLGLGRMGDTATFAAFFEVLQREYEQRNAEQIDWEKDYKPLMHDPLIVIQEVLTRAASQLGTQQKQVPGWQLKAAQERRVGFAIHLAPIFEEAFGGVAKSHNWAADFGKEHPWREFYRRIYVELFPKADRLNLTEVLQEAALLRPKLEAVTRELEQDATHIEDLRE